ncbi:RasGEF domain containing protein [Tritrichomonas foetus]|uniref:RasGEF domain containing protein n=1 Tax=Tritrichomonas foetus TaxID=1144522 RepID=A0A1J4J9Y0_9EUKA|nr:RasGEF domain containing protein [Tritrichomonas foetus]|eukprot:OHS94451.1 RasGEF domain containing protein [Tritrichomonas foetus]
MEAFQNEKLSNQQDQSDNPVVKKPPLPISSEYDMIKDNYFSDVDINRSNWLEDAIKKDPSILEFRERVNPLARAAKFGRLYLPNNRYLEQQTLLSLISQHFRTLGLVEAQSSLHSEWDGNYDIPAHLSRSQLTFLIQRGVSHCERFWELSSNNSHLSDEEQKRIVDEEISRIIGGAPNIVDDTNPIESEVPYDPHFILIDKEKRIITYASLNQIILILTSDTQVIMPELAPSFCLTYKSFVSSKALFSKIRERFRMAVKEKDQDTLEKTCNLFKLWLDEAGSEIEQPIIEAMKIFVEKEIKPIFPQIEVDFERTSTKYALDIDYSKAPNVNLGHCDKIWTGDFSLFDLPPEEIARQMTIWSCTKYYAIQRSELLDGAWQNPRLKHRAPNITALINHTNVTSKWIAFSILNEPTFEKRMQTFCYLIQVMRHLWELQNYYDVFSIFGGFNEPEIMRLNNHMAELSRKDHAFLDEVRRHLEEGGATWQLIRKLNENALKNNKPVLPYFGIYLSDLFKYDDVIKSKKDGLLNVEKCLKLYEFITKLEIFKKNKYCFLPIIQVQEKLDDLPTRDDETLMMISQEIEP